MPKPTKRITHWPNGNIKREKYHINGKLHRTDGPARIWYDENGNIEQEEYWVDDIKLTKEEFIKNHLVRKTKVINLLGGPGCGKTTLSHWVMADFKESLLKIEHVNEYVKPWAYEGKKVNQYDQSYIFAKQSKKESTFYHHVDYIVTDSPIHLSAVYDLIYSDIPKCQEAVKQFYKQTSKDGIEHYNFFLQRNKPYITDGRYEDKEQAKQRDVAILEYLKNNNIPYYFTEGTTFQKLLFIKKIILGENK